MDCEPAGGNEPVGRERSLGARLAVAVLGGAALMFAISSLSLWIYTEGARPAEIHTLIIPEGSNELIARGENPLKIPSNWAFLADDTLKLVNDDSVEHWIGSFFVPANTTREYTLQPSFGGSLLCSLHPQGAITIDVDVRDFDWRATLVPTWLLGPTVGLIILGVRSVVAGLDD